MNATLPTVTPHDLVKRALRTGATDFCADLAGVGTEQGMTLLAATAIDMVTDGETHPTRTRLLAMSLLAERGWEVLQERHADDEDAALEITQGSEP